jgi:hypothetical protein
MRDEAGVAKQDVNNKKSARTVVPRPSFEPGSSRIQIGLDNCWAVILEELIVTELIKQLRLN